MTAILPDRRSSVARGHAPVASALTIGREHWLVDVGLVILIVAPPLFTVVFGRLTPVLMMAALPLAIWLRHERMPAVLARCWPLLLLPLFALLSTFWSIRPEATGYYATLYLVTAVLGIILGAALERERTLIGLFVALQGFNVLSFLLGGMVTWSGGRLGTLAFAGLAGSKNMAGEVGAFGLLVALATLTLAIQRRAWLFVAIVGATIPITLWIIWNAHATGALIGSVVAAACLSLWLISSGLPRSARGAILIVVGLALAAAIATQSIWLPALFDMVLASSGKDAGLTGRAELWRKADYLIGQRPWVGLGYNAFWQPGNLDAEALWRAFGIGNKTGFHFHNSVRQVTVDLGYVGLVLYIAPAFMASAANFMRALRHADPFQTAACALTVYFIMELGFEVMGFSTLNHTTVIIFLVLAVGLRRDRDAPITARQTYGTERTR